jgi:hypothetical protein
VTLRCEAKPKPRFGRSFTLPGVSPSCAETFRVYPSTCPYKLTLWG